MRAMSLEREQRDGLVVVDTDPFKLYHVWALFRTGQASELEVALFRRDRLVHDVRARPHDAEVRRGIF